MRHPWMLYLSVFGGSFLATFILVPVFRKLALRLEVVDRPSEARKIHRRAIPYLGGLAFYFSFLLVTLFAQRFYPQHCPPILYPLCLVGTVFVMMGVYDDIQNMSSWKKLIVELILGGLLFLWGVRTTAIAHPLGGVWHIGWLALLITPLWIAGVMNAVNFSDGLDGLAAGMVAICAASIFAIAYRGHQVFSCMMMAYLIGTTVAFLCYNFHPASIFMGDAGALWLGFILGSSTLVENQKGAAIIVLTVPMVVMAIPILDTVLSFYRRLLRARAGKFFMPDRDHLHHRLLDLGLSQRQAVMALYYVSAGMGILAFILTVAPPAYSFLILLLAAMAIGFGVAVLHYVETISERVRNAATPDQVDKGGI